MILQGSCGEDRRGGLLHGIPVYPLEGTCHLFPNRFSFAVGLDSNLVGWICCGNNLPSFAKTFLTPWLPTRGRIPLDNCLDPGIQMEDALRGDGLLLTALET